MRLRYYVVLWVAIMMGFCAICISAIPALAGFQRPPRATQAVSALKPPQLVTSISLDAPLKLGDKRTAGKDRHH